MIRARGRALGLLLPVALVLIAAGWWVVAARNDGARGDWVEVERDDLVLGVEVTGTLRAVDSSTLGSPQIKDLWEYKISFMAPEAETVETGDVVVGFDTTKLEQDLREKQAEVEEARKNIDKATKELALGRAQDELGLAEARARLRKARLKVDVPPELQQGNELAQARLDRELAEREVAYLERRIEFRQRSAAAQLAALTDQLETAESRVREIREGIERMSVKATRAGTVIHVSDWRGEKKKVGDSTWIGEPVVELPDLTTMMGKGQVEEADAGRVVTGQPVRLRLDAHPDLEFNGRVGPIWRTVQRESWRNPLKVVRLEITLDETDTTRMRPGMRFRGTIETERVAGALSVPKEAVFPGAAGPVVYRRTLLGHEVVPVEVGRRNESRVEIVAGLAEGDRVSRRDLARGPA